MPLFRCLLVCMHTVFMNRFFLERRNRNERGECEKTTFSWLTEFPCIIIRFAILQFDFNHLFRLHANDKTYMFGPKELITILFSFLFLYRSGTNNVLNVYDKEKINKEPLCEVSMASKVCFFLLYWVFRNLFLFSN